MSIDESGDRNDDPATATPYPTAPVPSPVRSWHGSVNGHAQAVVVTGRGGPRTDQLASSPR